MKQIKKLFVSLAILGGFAAQAQSHPLETTIKNLVNAADELDGAVKQPGYVKDMQSDLDQMRTQVSGLIARSFLVPVTVADKNLSRAGWDMACMNPLCRQYEAKINKRGKDLESEALALKPEGFAELIKVVQDNRMVAKNVYKYVQNRDYVRPLPSNIVAELNAKFDFTRFDILNELEALAKSQIECIQYYVDAGKTDGLLANEVGANFQWSIESLQKKYGVSSVSNLTTKQKKVVASKIKDMSYKASVDFAFNCVSPAKAAFYQSESESLEKELGQ